ncbi:MAG: cell division protein FtsZ [Candidatus Staskawiczbacteria bacterium]|nr:cell division protein FtsZ [Candidatus Staskawiczbacteria bacterium]
MAKPKKKKVVKKVAKKKIKKPVKRRKILVKRKLKTKKTRKPVKLKKVKKSIKPKKILRKKVQIKKRAKKKPILKRKKVAVKKIKKRRRTLNAAKAASGPSRTESSRIGFPAESFFKARIKVIGIGGGGGSIVSEIGRSVSKAHFVIADTDIRALKKKNGIKYFWFGETLTHGLGTGVNVDLAKEAALEAKEKISETFKDQDIIIFIASLGGGLGSGATQVFAEAAREFGGITFGIFTLPFKFEGKNKQRIALNALKSLRRILNVSLVIPNEKIFKIIDANTPITQAFSVVNRSLIESLESLIDLIYNPGIINIDFADLRTILKGRGNTAFLNTVEESGKDRAEKICEKVLSNPLLQNTGFTAEKILFNISGAESLSMFEVEKISSHIANINPKSKIIFGISKDSKLKNKIKTTILMTGGELKGELPVPKPLSVKIKSTPKAEIKKPESEKEEKPKKARKTKKSSKKKIFGGNAEKEKNKTTPPANEEKQISYLPVFEAPVPSVPVLDQRRMNILEPSAASKKNIRRSGLEIRKAEEQEEKKRLAQEKEWEIPAFLRKVKFKN